MQILPISNNKPQLSFEAGKIKILNPNMFTDAELKAIANNNEFKKLATKLKGKNLDLFISLDRNMDSVYTRKLNLFSGKNDTPDTLIDKIIGPIWQVSPEKSSLIDNIVLFPKKIDTLFYKKTEDFQGEKKLIVKTLEKKNIFIEDLNYWHYSELKALLDNDNFINLAEKIASVDEKMLIKREFSDFHDMNYLTVFSNDIPLGTIFPQDYYYNKSSSITDAITKFDTFSYKPSEKIKEEALNDIEEFNTKEDIKSMPLMKRIKYFFNKKS